MTTKLCEASTWRNTSDKEDVKTTKRLCLQPQTFKERSSSSSWNKGSHFENVSTAVRSHSIEKSSFIGSWKNRTSLEYVSTAVGSQRNTPKLFQNGDITADTFRDSKTVIIQIVNCVAVKPHGLSQALALKYPYSDPYSSRRRIGRLNRAITEDRAKPGTIRICKSKTNSSDPIVVNMFGQYYMGKSSERNLCNRKISAMLQPKLEHVSKVSSSSFRESSRGDDNLLRGLESDTKENRILWFQQCLKELDSMLPKMNVDRVIIPYKIGCGLGGGDWERDYRPAIMDFVCDVEKYEIKAVIVKKT